MIKKLNTIEASPEDKQRALNVLNQVKDKPLMAKRMEALTRLFEQVTFADPKKD